MVKTGLFHGFIKNMDKKSCENLQTFVWRVVSFQQITFKLGNFTNLKRHSLQWC